MIDAEKPPLKLRGKATTEKTEPPFLPDHHIFACDEPYTKLHTKLTQICSHVNLMRNILCKFCVKFCVRFREAFVEDFVVKVSGTHPGRLSLKRFGVFGCERS